MSAAGILPATWTASRLGDCTSRRDERIDPQAESTREFWYVGLENIESHTGRLVDVPTVAGQDIRSIKNVFYAGDVLYGKLRPNLNKVHLAERTGVCSTDIWVLTPRPGLLPAYLAHYLRSDGVVRRLAAAAAGANLPRVEVSMFDDLRIPLPLLAEQARIVEILDEAASLRDLRRQADDKAREFLPAVIADDGGWRGKRKVSWVRSALGDMLLESPQNGVYKPASAYGQGVPIVRIADFDNGTIASIPTLRRVRLSPVEIERYAVRDGDILVNRVNSLEYLGQAVYVEGLTEPTVFESNMMRIRPDPQRLGPRYLVAFINGSPGRLQLLRLAKRAVNQASINQSDVGRVLLPVPGRGEIGTVEQICAEVGCLRGDCSLALLRVAEAHSALAARAFTGELTASWRARCKPAAHPRGNVAEAMAKVQRDHDALINSGIGRWLDNVASAQSNIAKWAQLADQQRRQFDGIFKQASRIAETTSWLEPIVRRQDQLTRMIEQTQWLSSTGAGLQAMAERWARQRAALTPSADFLRAVSADLEELRREQLKRSNPFAAELSARQLALLDRVHAAAAYVTAESLVEADRDLVLVQVRQDLGLLAALGLLIPLSAYDSASGVWSTAYRLPEDRDRVLPEALAVPAETAEATP